MSLQSVVASFIVELPILELPENFWVILCRILLPAGETSLTAFEKFSKIVLGGTAALHAYRVWGAVLFGDKRCRFLLALARDLALARLRLNRNAQRRTSNVPCRNQQTRIAWRGQWR